MADGSLIFDTKIDTSGFNKGTQNLKQQANSVQSAFKKAGATIAGIFFGGKVIKQIVQIGKESANLASDLQEVQNVVDTAFGNMAYKMEEFAATCIKNFGMSKLTAKEMGSTFMAMAKGMGQATDIASDKAIELTGRLGDIMSFYNKTASEANTIGKAIYTGETEPLKAIGVVMTETNLNAYALAKGYKKLYKEMTAADKLLVRQEYFLEQTAMAAGDFVKTQDSWANQTRILSEQWKELMTLFGNALIQVLTPTVKMLNSLVASLIGVGETLSTVFGITTSSNISEEAANARAELEALGNTVEETQEKSSGGIASFDKLEVVNGGNASSSEVAAIEDTVAAIKEEAEATEETEVATNELEIAIRRTGEALQWLGNVFETSFMKTFGDRESFENITASFINLKESLNEVFTSPDLQMAGMSFLNSLVYCLGSAAGMVVSVGTSLADGLFDGITKGFEKNREGIRESVVSLFKIGERWNEIYSELSVAVSEISAVFQSEEAKGITSSLTSIFITGVFEILEILGTFSADVLELLTEPFIENKEEISKAVTDTFAALESMLHTFQGIVENVFGTIRTVYDEKIQPLLVSLKEGFTEIGAKLLEVYEEYILPVITYASEKFEELANGPIAELIKKFGEFAGAVAEYIGDLWRNYLEPFVLWFTENIGGPVISGVLTELVGGFSKTVEFICGFLITLMDALEDALVCAPCDFAKKLDETMASVEKIFADLEANIKKIINGILGGIEGMANGAVKGINKVIEALNGLSFDIPDWVPSVGGETFGFNISKLKEISIPRLATGTVIPANYGEFAAILGDNKRETEVVSPLSTIEKALENVMKRMQINGGDITLIAQLDGEVIYKEVVKRDRIQKKRTGKSALA